MVSSDSDRLLLPPISEIFRKQNHWYVSETDDIFLMFESLPNTSCYSESFLFERCIMVVTVEVLFIKVTSSTNMTLGSIIGFIIFLCSSSLHTPNGNSARDLKSLLI